MLKSLLTTTALVALLAGGSAVAQTQSDTEAAPSPATGGEATMNNDAATGTTGGTTDPASETGSMGQTGEASDPATTDPASAMKDEAEDAVESTADMAPDTDTQTSAATTGDVGGFVTQQDESQVLATNYIGQTVVNGQDETVGKINDLVMDEQGLVTAAVIGVGGFLGIGEKNVGVPIDSIEVRRGEGTEVQLVMQSTREELESAPEFADLDEKMEAQEAARQEQELESQRQQMDTQPSTTTGTAN